MSRHGKLAYDKTRISVLVTIPEKTALEVMAAAERRTLSNYLSLAISRIVAANQGRKSQNASASAFVASPR